MLFLFIFRNYNFELSNNTLHKAFLIYIVDVFIVDLLLFLKPVIELKLITNN